MCVFLFFSVFSVSVVKTTSANNTDVNFYLATGKCLFFFFAETQISDERYARLLARYRDVRTVSSGLISYLQNTRGYLIQLLSN